MAEQVERFICVNTSLGKVKRNQYFICVVWYYGIDNYGFHNIDEDALRYNLLPDNSFCY